MNGVCVLLERTHITTLQLLAELGADSDRALLGATHRAHLIPLINAKEGLPLPLPSHLFHLPRHAKCP